MTKVKFKKSTKLLFRLEQSQIIVQQLLSLPHLFSLLQAIWENKERADKTTKESKY